VANYYNEKFIYTTYWTPMEPKHYFFSGGFDATTTPYEQHALRMSHSFLPHYWYGWTSTGKLLLPSLTISIIILIVSVTREPSINLQCSSLDNLARFGFRLRRSLLKNFKMCQNISNLWWIRLIYGRILNFVLDLDAPLWWCERTRVGALNDCSEYGCDYE